MDRWARALGCAAVLAASAAPAATSGSAAARTHSRCPSRAQIASLPRWRHGGRLRADVDGDGGPDTVTVRVARWAYGRCAFYLTVSTANGFYSRELGPGTLEMGKLDVNVPMRRSGWPALYPDVDAIVDLGGRGNVVVLSVGEGAANLGLSFFGLSGGRLQLLRVGRALSIWPGGTVLDQEGLACSRGGPLRDIAIGNIATRKHPHRWNFSSVAYRRRGSQFVAVARRSLGGPHWKVAAAAERAGMPNDPLTGCSIARNPNLGYAGF
jgi:hypothetical protein